MLGVASKLYMMTVVMLNGAVTRSSLKMEKLECLQFPP
jgi:hypothetical protein